MKIQWLWILLIGLTVAGCLRTRDDIRQIEQKKKLEVEVGQLRQQKADDEVKTAELEESLRFLKGRVEELEMQNSQALQDKVEKEKLLEEKLKIFEESILKIEKQQAQLFLAQQQRKSPPKKKLGNFQGAEVAFKKGQWQAAIAGYQKYREANPKGRRYALSTYKMGVAFQELGLKAEAKTYYNEVILRFPKSQQAGQAKKKLKQLK